MKDAFAGYYPPTDDEYNALWTEGLIVLDTNVLLDMYRLPATARDELLTVLETLSDRLWIPYQVALEFQRRRLTVIASERKTVDDAKNSVINLYEELHSQIEGLQVEKRGLGIDPTTMLAELKSASDKLARALQQVAESQLDIALSDPVRGRIDTLLQGKVGAPPTNQSELDKLCEGGDERYASRVPPGYEDSSKEKNPNEATFLHDGIRYDRKFGDLIFWRQIIGYAKTNNINKMLLITSERKEDWWWREKGKTIGPRPELTRELLHLGGVELFWMYSSSQFLENSRTYAKAKVSDQSVSQLEEVSRAASRDTVNIFRNALPQNPFQINQQNPFRSSQSFDYGSIERSVGAWLSQIYPEVRASREFPDFVVDISGITLGFDVKYVKHFDRLIVPPTVINSMLRGYMEVNEGRLSSFSLILVADESDFDILYSSGREEMIDIRISRLLSRYPIREIVTGFVSSDEEFIEVARQTSVIE